MKDDRLYLEHINEAIQKIVTYAECGRQEFLRNPMVLDAIVRNFQVIGEATKRLSNQAKDRHPEIPWRRIAGFRDVLIHDYMEVDSNEVWNVIDQQLPTLRAAVENLLS